MTLKNLLFSETAGQFQTNLTQSILWLWSMGIQIHVSSNEGPRPVPRENISKILKKALTTFENLQNHWSNFNQTWFKTCVNWHQQ